MVEVFNGAKVAVLQQTTAAGTVTFAWVRTAAGAEGYINALYIHDVVGTH